MYWIIKKRVTFCLVAPVFHVKASRGGSRERVRNDTYYLHTGLFLHLRHGSVAIVHYGAYDIFLKELCTF